MEPHRLDYLGPEMQGQADGADRLVPGIDAARGGVLRSMDEMADIMEEGRNDERLGRPFGLGEGGTLQRMRLLRHGLARIGVGAAPFEEGENLIGEIGHRGSGRRAVGERSAVS